MSNLTAIITVIAGIQSLLLVIVKWRRDRDMVTVRSNAQQLSSTAVHIEWLSQTCKRQDEDIKELRAAHDECQKSHLESIQAFAKTSSDSMAKVAADTAAQIAVKAIAAASHPGAADESESVPRIQT